MRELFFFLKSFLKKPVMWVSLAVVFAVSFFAFASAALREPLPCALYSEDAGKEAQKVVAYLEENGFHVCGSYDEAQEMVMTGKADTGVILRDGFGEKLAEADLRECTELIVSERSQKTSMYKLMAAVAIYQQLMPYSAAEVAVTMGYDADYEDITAFEEEIKDRVNPLEFHITSVDGADIEVQENFDLPIGIAAICCFAILGFLCVAVNRRNGRMVRQRFESFGSFALRCILPQNIASGLYVLIAAGAGTAAAAAAGYAVPFSELALPFVLYMVLLVLIFTVLVITPLSDNLLICIIAIDAAVSLVLCPLYSGSNLLLGFIAPFRMFSIPYYMFLLMMAF